MKLKPIFRKVHKWIGLVIALYLIFQSTSGLLLLFRDEIEILASREDVAATESLVPATLEKVLVNLANRYPDYEISRIYFPDTAGASYLAHIQLPGGSDSEVIEIGKFTGSVHGPGRITDFYYLILKLHHELGLGQSGAYVAGTLGGVLVFMSISGFWLWWPGWRRIPRSIRLSKVSTEIRDLFDLHRVTGAACATVILVTAISGFAMGLAGPLRSALDIGVAAVPNISHSAIGNTLSADDLLGIAQAAMPDARVRDIRFAQPGNLLTTVVFHRDTPAGAGPFHRVWVDPFTGTVRRVLDSRQLDPGNTVLDWMYPMHTELGLATAGKLVLAASGFGVLLLSLTGPLLWAKKRLLRGRAARYGSSGQVVQ